MYQLILKSGQYLETERFLSACAVRLSQCSAQFGVCFSKHALSVLLARPEAAGVSSLACGDAPASPRSLHQLSGASFWYGRQPQYPTDRQEKHWQPISAGKSQA
ncbi:hypothetical protein [Rhizobium lusitanum]|uniref:hypothetical protein n=1 Tax=Rhizobium lusitanum TaxID=293958 RepID=UPI0016192FFA|nr:hypothetical protein [Rhizobium lusitanum]